MTAEKFEDWTFKAICTVPGCGGEVDTTIVDGSWGYIGEHDIVHMECLQMKEGAEVPKLT